MKSMQPYNPLAYFGLRPAALPERSQSPPANGVPAGPPPGIAPRVPPEPTPGRAVPTAQKVLVKGPKGTVVSPSEYTIPIPPGWKIAISSISHQSYNQGVCTEYTRHDRQVRNMLASPWGRTGSMCEIKDGTNSVIIEPVTTETKLTLHFYASRNQLQSKDKLITSRAYAKGISPVRTDSIDGVTFVIDVHDVANSQTRDQVVTIVYTVADLNLINIQGDVLPGLPKAVEHFYYFKITDLDRFRLVFRDYILPKIVTSAELVFNGPPSPREDRSHPFRGLNVAFTSIGLALFGLDPAELGDDAFLRGQLADARSLGDAGSARGDAWSPDWDAEYKANIDGIFLITAYNDSNAQSFVTELEQAFEWAPRRSSIKKIVSVHGHPRPGIHEMNDPFGWRGGGFTNPQVRDVTFVDEVRYTGAPVIPMGIIVIGREGDEDADKRPDWAKDGSLIATRKLNCLVPEFDRYLAAEGPKVFPDLSAQAAAEKLGARLMGRWKNGTSVEMSPDHDAPDIAKDDKQVNNFMFDQQDTKQQRCPFAAHIRKSNPRNDVPPEDRFLHLIRRHNMPYGPEVTDEERKNGTLEDRGLHLCAYQSSIERGFRFIQRAWYNDETFPPKSTTPGWDPIFGQTGDEKVHRFMSGVDPTKPKQVTTFERKFVDPRGGEYFFSPSMTTLRQHIAV